MIELRDFETDLIHAFVEALQGVPSTRAQVEARDAAQATDRRVDFVIDATVGGKPLTILVEAKQTAFPRDVREATWRLREFESQYAAKHRAPVLPVVIAEAISTGARETLRDGGIGYFDRSGSLYIPTPGAFVFIDRPQPKAKRRALGAIFYGRKAQVLQALFERRDQWVTGRQIADASAISEGTVSQTLKELERREWVEARGTGPAKQRRLTDAAAMVDAWAKYLSDQKPPRARRYYVPADSETLAHRLAEVCEHYEAAYAVTGEAAAQIYAPYLTSVSQTLCRMMAGPAARQALDMLGARPVAEGWNLGVVDVKTEAELGLGETVNGVRLARPLQVYVDLLQGSGRSKDMAEHFRGERLRA